MPIEVCDDCKGTGIDCGLCRGHRTVLALYTIYANPSDHPGKFVVGRDIPLSQRRDGELSVGPAIRHGARQVFDTLAEARAAVPADGVRLERFTEDDPVIVECWL